MDGLQGVIPQQEQNTMSVVERSKMCIGSWKNVMLPNSFVTGVTVRIPQPVTNDTRTQLVTNPL